MDPDTLETIHGVIMGLLGIQIVYSFLIFLLGNIIYDQYEVAIFKNPSNVFQKTFNFIGNFLFGLGPFVYKKLLKYPWILRKIYMLLATIIMTITSIPIYFIIKKILDSILLLIFN